MPKRERLACSIRIFVKIMRKIIQSLLLAGALLPCVAAELPAPNTSFKPGQLWLDDEGVAINAHGPGYYKEGDTYYWFGEHKIAGDAGNYAHVGVRCYSSKDLYNWKNEGVALAVEDSPESSIAKGCILERPKVIYNKKTGKYVMWFHLERKGHGYNDAMSGVAVSDKVSGPYKFLHALRPNAGKWPMNMPEAEKTMENPPKVPTLNSSSYPADMKEFAMFKRDFEKGQMARDMTLYVDTDGKGYHIFASEDNGTMHIAELNDDFTSHSGKFVRVFPGRFMEAPAICKKDGVYYLIASGCTGWWPNTARSAYAENIMGPWTELKNPCVGADADKTFGGQSTYILTVPNGGKTEYVFVADQWRPQNAIDGRYVWLPIQWDGHQMKIEWKNEWKLDKP